MNKLVFPFIIIANTAINKGNDWITSADNTLIFLLIYMCLVYGGGGCICVCMFISRLNQWWDKGRGIRMIMCLSVERTKL